MLPDLGKVTFCSRYPTYLGSVFPSHQPSYMLPASLMRLRGPFCCGGVEYVGGLVCLTGPGSGCFPCLPCAEAACCWLCRLLAVAGGARSRLQSPKGP